MGGESPVILIVEDDDAIRQSLVELLQAEGYAVDGVGDGPAALAYLAERTPALILLDMLMPGMTGVEFRSRQMKSAVFGRVPVVLMSAVIGNLGEYAAYLGASDHVAKPIDPDRLIAVVARHTRPQSSNEEALKPAPR